MTNNHAFLKGNLTHDPFFDYLDGRDGPVPFMRFYLAVDRTPESGADFFQVVSYGQRALHDFSFLQKGSEVAVTGWFRSRKVSHNGKDSAETTLIELVADNVTFVRNINWARGKACLQELRAQESL